MQYASSASFLLAVYSTYLSAANAHLQCPEGQAQPMDLLTLAQSQVCIHVLDSIIYVNYPAKMQNFI